jgi:hypothetical protein
MLKKVGYIEKDATLGADHDFALPDYLIDSGLPDEDCHCFHGKAANPAARL